MSLFTSNSPPTLRQIRGFSLIVAGLCVLLALWGGFSSLTSLLWIGAGGLCVSLGWFAPKIVRPVFVGMTWITTPLGWIVGEACLLFLFLGIFTPIGWLRRAMRSSELDARLDRKRTTYWSTKLVAKDVTSYFRRY